MFVAGMCHHSTIQYIVVVVVRQSQDRATLVCHAAWHDKSGLLGQCECQRHHTVKEFVHVYDQITVSFGYELSHVAMAITQSNNYF